uniref:Uncharacterized protein n=1 Tax=Anguilla anguilla TaxID=7936 RepID=A0A0E9V2G9_ANGAN
MFYAEAIALNLNTVLLL